MSNDRIHVQTDIDRETELAEKWKDWADDYNTTSDAVRQALQAGLNDDDRVDSVMRGLYAGIIALDVVLLETVRQLYGMETMFRVFGLSLVVFTVVYAAPGVISRVRGRFS